MKLSIIIATHDRPKSLARLLSSLAPQLQPDRDEVIVAENGTPEPVAIPSNAPPLKHVHDTRPGKCRVQNQAIENSSGDVLIFLDDDVTVAPSYLGAVAEFFDRHPEFAAMAGRIVAAEDPVTKVGPRWVYLDLPIFDQGSQVREVRGVLGANMAFRRVALDRVGKFDERLGPGAAGHEEETEMSQRIRRASLHIGYYPGALALHEVDPDRADRDRFLRVCRERGRCRMLHEKHPAREVLLKIAIGRVRLAIANSIGAGIERIAREERRLEVARGMFDGLGGVRSK